MRIANLYVSNFLGLQHAEVALRAPVALFCGKNAAGKSSLRDAVALALTADLGRVHLKKEAPALIRHGADLAVCEVKDADGDEWRVTITAAGKIADSQKGREPEPVLSYVLDAQRLARLDPTERRAFLFGLMGVKMDQGEIARRLEARGGHIGKMTKILPLLRSGFDAASKQAKTYATEAKGAWRTVTGETYGSEKAKAWRAAVPPYDAAAAQRLATELQHADVAIGQWQEQIGKLQAEEQRRAQLRAKLPALAEAAGKLQRVAEKLATDEQQLADWDADLKKTAAAAGVTPREGLVHDLARLLYSVAIDPLVVTTLDIGRVNDLLSQYEREYGRLDADGAAGDSKARDRLPSVQRSRDLMASAVANDRRDLAVAQAAKDEQARITAELAEVFDAAALADAREQVEKLKATRAATVAESDKLKSIKAMVDSAEAKTKQAGEHAVDVAAWDLIGDALSPDGIPAEILAEALGPINARLAQSALDTDWPRVEIASDMAIRTGLHERPYALLSESERWRADAMLAEAIAHVSGARLLVLDRMDVLDLQGRGELLGWLDVLAENGEIDTALLFATLKQPPAGLGERVQVEWIEAGMAGQQPLKAAA
jgi:hypothetical protein